MKLTQSRGVLRIDSEIVSDGVMYSERGLLSSHETKIPFEHTADELVRTFHVSRLYLFISLFFALAFAYRLVRFMSTDDVTVLSLSMHGLRLDDVRRTTVELLAESLVSPTHVAVFAQIEQIKLLVQQLAGTPSGDSQSRELVERIGRELDLLKRDFGG